MKTILPPPGCFKTVELPGVHLTICANELSLQDRLDSYRKTGFPQCLSIGEDGRIVGTWIMGNDYRVKSGFYGGYPPTYLRRIAALFPDRRKVLHLFSGKVNLEEMPGDTVDVSPEHNPTWVDDAQRLTKVPVEDYDLVLADPPYSVEDCERYQCSMVKRNLVMGVLGERLQPGAFVVWLDQVLPMYKKEQFSLVGCIGMYKSTNHRIRGVSIFRKNDLTDKQKSVKPSTPAHEGQTTNTRTEEMNTKILALIMGILATAAGQIKNVLAGAGGEEEGKKPKKPTKPEPDPEDDDDIQKEDEDSEVTTNIEDDDADVPALKAEAKELVSGLLKKDTDTYKPKIKKLLNGSTIGEMDDADDLKALIAGLKKLKGK